ncbi:MAG: hypothetical protein PHO15_09940 [Eubacteriales bacterium]|nr:hypothetical protein [Eubacteriales bacterium]
MGKLIRLLFLIFISAGLLFGCSAQEDKQAETGTPSLTATGGVSGAAENINLKEIDISADGDQTVVTLSLLSGSREAGYAETKLTQLPEYEIVQLDQPQRIMVRLENISFWDYKEDPSWALSDFVLGLFREVPADDDSLIIYIQLSQSAVFSVEESEGDLIIRLTPGSENAGSKYFCVSNSFYEHQEGTWPDSIDMMPVLCSDSINRLLISEPFDTQDEAESFMETANMTLSSVLPDNIVYVVALEKNALPDNANNVDYSIADDKNVIMKDGIIIDTPLLLQNGKYLATAADGHIAFSRRYKPEEPALEQDSYQLSEKLWILDPNGRIQNINIADFYAIDQVAFSADGRYICILDVSIENRVLYVYDFDTETPINLGEEGFGSQTAAFAWSDVDNTLYAMTGYSSMQMMSCTFQTDGSFDIDAVEEEAGSEGYLGVSDGRLFFADNYAGDAGVIYEISDTRRVVTEGIDFSLSSDGKTMLVLEMVSASSSEDEQVLTSLKLCDIETGEETYIVEGADIVDFCFSRNGNKVYYTEAMSDGAESGYDFGLYAYDITTGDMPSQLALSCTADFATAPETGTLYFIYFVDNADDGFYATYIYELS